MPDNLSLGPINATTLQVDISGGGSSVILPSADATTNKAGLMSADDKAKIIKQGGNIFTDTMRIGTNDGNPVIVRVNGTDMAAFGTDNNFAVQGVRNLVNISNSSLRLNNSGAVITRNVGDTNPALIVNNANTGSTGNIANFQYLGNTFAKVTYAGYIQGLRLGANLTGANPSYLLDINAGVVAGANILASFSQNAGSIKLENGTGQVSSFAPTIRGIAKGTFPWGILIQGQGATSYGRAGVLLRAVNVDSDGPVTDGNTFQLENNTTPQLAVDFQGVVTVNNLAGTGTRMVTADSTGALSAINEVSSGTYAPSPTIVPSGTSTAHGFTYMRIGKIVTVTGLLAYNGASTGTSTIEIALPIPSTFINNEDLVGVVTGNALAAASPNYVIGDGSSNIAQVNFSPGSSSGSVTVQFQYQVL